MAQTTKTIDPPVRPARAVPVMELRPALRRGQLGAGAFTWGTLFCCLVLQRFAIPAGG